MATQPIAQTHVSVEEYLAMKFEHDAEYIDGAIRERALVTLNTVFFKGFYAASSPATARTGASSACRNSTSGSRRAGT